MHLIDTYGLPTPRPATIGLVLAAMLSACSLQAITVSYSGTLSGDDQVQQYVFSTPTNAYVDFSTDSYGGGTVNGITTPSGGFVPVLSVFNASTGALLASDGGDGACSGSMMMDPGTSMCDDANLMLTLTTGSYIVAVSEFFNVPVGPNLSDGFLEQGQGNFTGPTCGTTGAFYETDVAPCVQRTGNFALNITNVPEPSDLWLAIPAIAFGLFRRRSAKS